MFRIISGILVLSSQSPLGPAPTAMGWGEELLDRAAIHRLNGPGRSYIILTGPGDAGPHGPGRSYIGPDADRRHGSGRCYIVRTGLATPSRLRGSVTNLCVRSCSASGTE